jgi:hypothetical protein
MDVFAQLLVLENIVLCLSIVALVWVQRKLAEMLIPSLLKSGTKAHKWWSEFFVPLGPIGTGGLLTLMPQLPVPEIFAGSLMSRMIFGIFLGLISGLVFRLVKKNFLDKIGPKTNNDETPYLNE